MVGEITSGEPRLGDLIEVPPVRTVVQVADLADPVRRRELVADFVLTQDAARALAVVLEAVARGRGQGFFLQGNYGSGKSHLLTVLSLALSEPGALRSLLAKDEEGRLAGPAQNLVQGKYLVVNVSLVEHAAAEPLEQIVLRALVRAWEEGPGGGLPLPLGRAERERLVALLAPYQREIGDYLAARGLAGEEELWAAPAELERLLRHLGLPLLMRLERRAVMTELKREMERVGLRGVVFLLDELSEFLRSKPDGRSFNEDVRFLQFLGEEAGRLPAWIVATLQESIEGTGEIPPGTYNKIKDRYPVRLHLTGEHLKQLVSRRLIRQKPGVEAKLATLLQELRRAFGPLPWPGEEWQSLYPVHPATIRFLTELRPLFSQHRGVVDFVHYRLRGDAARKIPSLLEAPWDTFLTPDLIFDHFRDRLRETLETNPYVDLVYAYYEREGEQLFPDAEERAVALRLVKLLILAAAAPNPLRLSVRELTHCLVHRYSRLEPSANYEFIARLLQQLAQRAAYIAAEPGTEPLADIYRIDLEADVHGLVWRQIEHETARLFPEDRRLVTAFLPWLERPYLPLASLAEKTWSRQRVNWQGTTREVLLWFGPLPAVEEEELAGLAGELEKSEADLVFFLDYPLEPASGRRCWEEQVVPHLAARGLERAALFWQPEPLAERAWLAETLGCLLLREQYAEDETARGRKINAYLEGLLAERRPRVEQLFQQAYYAGRILDSRGETVLQPSQLGFPPFTEVLARAAAPILQARFPRHIEIAPQTEAITTWAQQRVLTEFLLPGEGKRHPDPDLRLVLDAVLVPLKIARRSDKEYRLVVDERHSPVVRELLETVGRGEHDLKALYWRLRKGPFGLTYTGFRLLVLALAAAGVVRLGVGGRYLTPAQLSIGQFARLETIVPGELLGAAEQELLAGITWLPATLRRPPLTYEKQERLWQHLVASKQQAALEGEELRRRLQAFPDLPQQAALLQQIERYLALFAPLEGDAGPQAGLETFLKTYRAHPAWEEDQERYARLKAFCTGGKLEELAFRLRYLARPELLLAPPYEDLAQQKEELRAALAGERMVFDPLAWQEQEKAWLAFQSAYGEAYRREHAAERGAARYRAYRELAESPLLRALAALFEVQVLHVSPDFLQVREVLQTALRSSCAEEPALEREPVCRCGFRLGQKLELPPVGAIEALARRSLVAYLTAVQERRDRIEAYAREAASIGRQRLAVTLEQILAMSAADPDPARLVALLDEETVRALREALAGKILVVRRSLAELTRRLAGRTLSLEDLRRLFEDWLAAGELAPGTYIEVKGDGLEDETRN